MKRILALSTDTPHHRYMFDKLVAADLPLAGLFFETSGIQNPFGVDEGFSADEAAFESQAFGEIALPESCPVFEFANVNEMSCMTKLEELEPDFGIVFGTRKLSKELIGKFKDGLINVHRGIAQKYRGLDSDLWAIYHRDYKNIGVTLHLVEALLDTGAIAQQESMQLRPGYKCHQIRYYTSVIATDLMLKAVSDYLSDSLQTKKQSEKGRYYSFMPPEIKRVVRERFDKYCEQL